MTTTTTPGLATLLVRPQYLPLVRETAGDIDISTAEHCAWAHSCAPSREMDAGRRVRVLNVMGLRAQESGARAKKAPVAINKYPSVVTL